MYLDPPGITNVEPCGIVFWIHCLSPKHMAWWGGTWRASGRARKSPRCLFRSIVGSKYYLFLVAITITVNETPTPPNPKPDINKNKSLTLSYSGEKEEHAQGEGTNPFL